MQEIEIFKPGEHRPMQGAAIRFSEADLAACAAAYDPARHEAPLVIGHPATDDPAWGWVKSLKFADGALIAVPDQVNPAFETQVKAGAYKKVSASFWRPDAPNNPTPGSWALRHVGFLGAQPPAVKGLAPIQFAGEPAEGADGVVSFGMEEAWGWGAAGRLFRGLREWIIAKEGPEAADRALSSWDIDAIAAAEQAERDALRQAQREGRMIDLIITRLKTHSATANLFRAVEGLAELAALNGPPVLKPAAYVFPLREDPEPNIAAFGEISQKVIVTIGVMIFAQNLSDATGRAALSDIQALRAAVKAALHGFSPGASIGAGWQPLQLGPGELADLAGGIAQWQDSFTSWRREGALVTS